ncbi:MAG: YeiH family protein [Roseinatronobacter sp.]
MTQLNALRARATQLAPGMVLAATIAAAAAFLGAHYGAPVMLFALLLGMAFNFLHQDGPCRSGIDFSGQMVLRLGVGLLGIRIALDDLISIGLAGAGLLAGLIVLTIAAGFLSGALTRRPWHFALLAGGAVAICGASAALAIAAVLPARDESERNTLFTVISVTALSTIAMVLYPLLFGAMGFSEAQQGFLIGATIHDVAQVVGAGFLISDAAGDIATLTKLFRVAMLPLVLVVIVLALRVAGQQGQGARIPLLPWFMVLFLALMTVGSLVDLPSALVGSIETLSRALLVMAIAALGVKTSLRTLTSLGGGHLVAVVMPTLVLLIAAMVAMHLFDLI